MTIVENKKLEEFREEYLKSKGYFFSSFSHFKTEILRLEKVSEKNWFIIYKNKNRNVDNIILGEWVGHKTIHQKGVFDTYQAANNALNKEVFGFSFLESIESGKCSLEVYECNCLNHVAFDSSYLDQVNDKVSQTCISCKQIITPSLLED